VVEIVSPNETVYELEEKLEDYQKVGVPLIWVINPKSRTVKVYRVDGSVDHLREDGVLSGEDIIPGFRCPLREILPQREPLPEVEQSPKGPNGSQ
jgi:Uma2 family endonuclease